MTDLIETMARAMCAAQCELGIECVDCSFWDADDVAARAALAAIEAAGYRVVPVEPTEAMVRGGGEAYDHPNLFMGGASRAGKRLARAVYAAMLDAAPKHGGPR